MHVLQVTKTDASGAAAPLPISSARNLQPLLSTSSVDLQSHVTHGHKLCVEFLNRKSTADRSLRLQGCDLRCKFNLNSGPAWRETAAVTLNLHLGIF